jgi:hypothetical protein
MSRDAAENHLFQIEGKAVMQTKIITGLCVATVAAILAFAAIAAEDPHRATTGNTIGEPAVLNLQGTGRQASNKFKLSKGLAIIHTNYQGQSNFIVGLLNSEGEHVQGLFNQIDNYEGTRGFEIPKDGEYLFNVQAAGPWTFNVEQPRPTHGESLPQSLSGNRSDVTPFLSLHKGLTVFKFNYQGEGRFVATLVDQTGREIEQLANNLDTFEASTPVKIPHDGIYFLNISAYGPWHVEIQ